jgi:hypothetical protein
MKTDGFMLVSKTVRELDCSAATVRQMEARGLKAHRTPTGKRIFLANDVRRLKAERSEHSRYSGGWGLLQKFSPYPVRSLKRSARIMLFNPPWHPKSQKPFCTCTKPTRKYVAM